MPGIIEWLLLSTLWAPVLVLLHELGHAIVAMALTDGEVSVEMDGAGLAGGRATYDPSRLRRASDELWIVAAGPAVSLACAVALWIAVFALAALAVLAPAP